jgi:hypothetical protein
VKQIATIINHLHPAYGRGQVQQGFRSDPVALEEADRDVMTSATDQLLP